MHPKDPNPQRSGEQKAEIRLTLKTLSSQSQNEQATAVDTDSEQRSKN